MKALTLSFLLLPLLVAAGCSHEAAQPPMEKAEPIGVTTVRVAPTDLPNTFEAGGIVRARYTATVASRVMAPVTAVHVRAGDRVRRGAPLIDLDSREMRAYHERSVAAAEAADRGVNAAEADLASAQAGLTLARATHRRIADLADKKSATANELDQAVAALAAAEAQVQGAEARRASARATRDAAQAAGAATDAGLSYTRLTAPFDGIVTQRLVDPGTMATPGAPLVTLEDPQQFRVEALMDETRASQVAVGTLVEVAVSQGDLAASWSSAAVTEVARVDPASHAFAVKVDLPDEMRTRSGTFARIRVIGASRRVLAIPTSAVIHRGQLSFVFAVAPGSVARLRAVSTGATRGEMVEVLAGLAEGDTVVTGPPPALVDGRPVQPAGGVAAAQAGAGR